MNESFDVAIVGAGPAGISAACILADAGIKTIVFERGEYPGAKNMSGGVLYGYNLAQILPDFATQGSRSNVILSNPEFSFFPKMPGSASATAITSLKMRENIMSLP